MSTASTTKTAPVEPTAKQWRDAFMEMEDRILRIDNHAKVANYLAAALADDAEDKGARQKLGFVHLAEVTARATFNLIDAAREADKAYYEFFNELVAQENAALIAAQPQRMAGGQRNG